MRARSPVRTDRIASVALVSLGIAIKAASVTGPLLIVSVSVRFHHPIDTFISKTTRLYQDPHTAQASAPMSNMDKLNTDLQDVTRIMTKNMEDLLWRGDSLDREC